MASCAGLYPETMQVHLQQVVKRFEGRIVLEGVDLDLKPGDRTVIGGANGAGKSTLLKLIAAYLRPSDGKVEHRDERGSISPEKVYQHIALAAPYLQFPRDLTVLETIRSWGRFRSLREKDEEIPEKMKLKNAMDRPVRELSSGMEQRLKLGIAFASKTPLLLLDEPLTNIDAAGRELYHERLKEAEPDRTILICSNDVDQEAPTQHIRYQLEEGGLYALP